MVWRGRVKPKVPASSPTQLFFPSFFFFFVFCVVVFYKYIPNNILIKCNKQQEKYLVSREKIVHRMLNTGIHSINRPVRLLDFWTLRVGACSRWALIRGWTLIKFSSFSASVVCLFCNKTINGNNKTRR